MYNYYFSQHATQSDFILCCRLNNVETYLNVTAVTMMKLFLKKLQLVLKVTSFVKIV